MTNKERQTKLDKLKWEESNAYSVDMTGAMYYCMFCSHRINEVECKLTQEERETVCACATAYNKFNTNKNKKNKHKTETTTPI